MRTTHLIFAWILLLTSILIRDPYLYASIFFNSVAAGIFSVYLFRDVKRLYHAYRSR